MGRLLLLFIIVPAAELALLIEIGSRIGTLPTLGIIAGTGFLGAALARHQGLGILKTIRQEMNAGRLPATSMVDGVMVLLAGAVLMTPGILTDALGFLLLVPFTRSWLRGALWNRLKNAVQDGRVQVNVSVGMHGNPPPGREPRAPRSPSLDDRPDRDLEQ
jgi:UPF0716 protein FxsA